MSDETLGAGLSISDAYRRSRTTVGLFCGLSIAWSAAQIEFNSISIELAGQISLSNASIPLILTLAIGFTFTRLLIEFSMQPIPVRRWALARTDLAISVWLVRLSIFSLGVGALHRSIETLGVALLVASAFVVVGILNVIFFSMILMPITMWWRKGGVAAGAAISTSLAELFTVLFMFATIIALGFGSIYYEPLASFYSVAPAPLSMAVAVASFIVVFLSVYLERHWLSKVVAEKPRYKWEKLPDGSERITFLGDEKSSCS